MMRLVGAVILFTGFAIMAVGIAFAFQTFAGIYHDVAADPLAQSASSDEPEREAAGQILRWAALGLGGAVIAGIGAFISMIAKRKRRRAQRLS